MKKKVWKLFCDYEKEEVWINEMAKRGLALTDYTFARYTFDECERGEYIYRIERLDNKMDNAERDRYISFMEENGAEHIADYFAWIYFRKKAKDGTFVIYSDLESRIKHYKGIADTMLIMGFAELCISFSQISTIIDYIRGEAVYGGFRIVLSAMIIIITVMFFGFWIKYAKKISKLRREREIHE